DATVINEFLRLLRLAPEVRHLVDWRRATDASIGFKAASKLAQLPDNTEQIRVCRAALQHRFSKAEVEQVVQLRRRSEKPIEDCISEALRLRPRVQQLNVFLGAVTSPQVRTRLGALTQADRDELLQSAVRRRFPAIGPFGSRLGPDRFTI